MLSVTHIFFLILVYFIRMWLCAMHPDYANGDLSFYLMWRCTHHETRQIYVLCLVSSVSRLTAFSHYLPWTSKELMLRHQQLLMPTTRHAEYRHRVPVLRAGRRQLTTYGKHLLDRPVHGPCRVSDHCVIKAKRIINGLRNIRFRDVMIAISIQFAVRARPSCGQFGQVRQRFVPRTVVHLYVLSTFSASDVHQGWVEGSI